MKTQIEISPDQLAQLIYFSGAKSKRDALRWAIEEAIRSELLRDMLGEPHKRPQSVRTVVDVSDEQMDLLLQFSGAKQRRDALAWAFGEAIRSSLSPSTANQPLKIAFDSGFLRGYRETVHSRNKRRSSRRRFSSSTAVHT